MVKIIQISSNKCVIRIPAKEYPQKWIWISQIIETFGGRLTGPGYTYEIPAAFTQIDNLC